MHCCAGIPRTDVGVLKHKLLAQFIFRPVHFGADNAEERLAVNQDSDAVLLHHLIESARLIDIFQLVCQPTAASVPYTDLDQLWVGLVKQCAQLFHSSGCELHSCLAGTELGSGSSSRLGLLRIDLAGFGRWGD